MSLIREEIRHLAVPIAQVRPYGRNANMGDTEAVKESLRAHKQYRPVVVNERTGEILAGNHTYAAMLELGAELIAVTPVDVDDEQAERINLADNQIARRSKNDEGALLSQLEGLPDLKGTGFEQADLDKLLAATNAAMNLERDVCPECQRPL